ncbi:concanavalin A-like lectin/glucanase domain-containing protein [Rhizophagus clarus]|uniref:Concanavalin A-like lectin/glucanase domain-containing protein n=1 Tax=Rhizophagus clarus TaxID=94130 RepID=A0A8H3M6W1_9GLOM|nr:concanavalin A-like lectin/glucanase domain-containing protein [Rhizophagus clarus]
MTKGYSSILAARSEVFDRLLYNGMKESYDRQISFPKINSDDYFQLSGLQDFIIKTVFNIFYPVLMEKKRLPTLEQIEQVGNSAQIDNKDKSITNHQEVAKELEPLVKYIDFMRIEGQILADIIEPLEIISVKMVVDVYREKAKLYKSHLNKIRGIYSNCVWDESACGSKLIVEENGKVVYAPDDLSSWQNIKAKMLLENTGIFEWDVIVEKVCQSALVGVCVSENLDYELWAGSQPTGWLLCSNGYCYNSDRGIKYCPPFRDGAKITVHLDMNKRTCSFTVNGTKYPEVSVWNILPSKLCPVASLRYPARFRIEPHQ